MFDDPVVPMDTSSREASDNKRSSRQILSPGALVDIADRHPCRDIKDFGIAIENTSNIGMIEVILPPLVARPWRTRQVH